MPVTNDFDRFFLNLPPFDRADDFNSFWDSSIDELSKIPIEPHFNKKKIANNFEVFDVIYKSYGKSPVRGELYLPVNIIKPKVLILIPDYNTNQWPMIKSLDNHLAYFLLKLRGYEAFKTEKEGQNEHRSKTARSGQKETEKSPGYMTENILNIKNYYVHNIYMDAYRSVDLLRLFNKLNCSQIGIIGKGLGASAAVFVASVSNRVKAIALEAPSFCYLELSQNISESDSAREINAFLSGNKSKKSIVKKNLTYFDSINHSDKISCSVLVSAGLKDTSSPPECVFALFNHMRTEKTIEVYPEDGNEAGGKDQFAKSISWSMQIINREG